MSTVPNTTIYAFYSYILNVFTTNIVLTLNKYVCKLLNNMTNLLLM